MMTQFSREEVLRILRKKKERYSEMRAECVARKEYERAWLFAAKETTIATLWWDITGLEID